MGKGRLSSAAVVVALAFAPIVLASPAALDSHVVAVPPSVDPVGTRGGFTPGAVADVAGTLTFVNADISAHDVVAVDPGPEDQPWCARFLDDHGYCPLFASSLVGIGGQSLVRGTDQLEPGTTYAFYCSVHHWMTGTIVAI